MTSAAHGGRSLGSSFSGRTIELRFHSHITDRLASGHKLATRRVSSERCEAILHLSATAASARRLSGRDDCL
jgi:hypothetical protein